ncbi:hypothetical protein BKH46_00815 [Helicobacter sp. 12S02634-8]|uniref:hypothetical protein n=1 Tax=Helicobacter sp. 12S02634-8 TaxID=1476199 RepID=UPI000BA63A30|nr:hypothetical protein [Helicobacter sp. 12S02634-8]PAF48484.1 hypothetical protein BKH46_00815 [Helicobacter sp. 12S02634-8]
MKKLICCLLSLQSLLLGQWQMFSDKTDTYIYNTDTGEIYIRYRSNKKNYEDVFVKMPKGVIPQDSKHITSPTTPKQNDTALEAIKKANEMLNHSIEGGM